MREKKTGMENYVSHPCLIDMNKLKACSTSKPRSCNHLNL